MELQSLGFRELAYKALQSLDLKPGLSSGTVMHSACVTY